MDRLPCNALASCSVPFCFFFSSIYRLIHSLPSRTALFAHKEPLRHHWILTSEARDHVVSLNTKSSRFEPPLLGRGHFFIAGSIFSSVIPQVSVMLLLQRWTLGNPPQTIDNFLLAPNEITFPFCAKRSFSPVVLRLSGVREPMFLVEFQG